MSTQAPAPPASLTQTAPRATRVRHNVAGVFAQYIQDLTRPVQQLGRPVDPVPCVTCP